MLYVADRDGGTAPNEPSVAVIRRFDLRTGTPTELIAQNMPNAASMCYDAGVNQLVIPMNPNNGLAFIGLR